MCENCKKRQATIHLTEIINSNKKEVHLCEQCAEKQGVVKQQMSIADFLAGLAAGGAHPAAKHKLPDIRCPSCGLSLADFQSGGRFGCADDYTVFRERIMPLIEKIHDSTQHVGKTPARAGGDVAHEKELRQLQSELKRAVDREEYEEAARLRDKIRRLEEECKTKQDKESAPDAAQETGR
jgi:protein arginine kinase activator